MTFSQAWIDQNSGTTSPLHSISFCDSLNGFAAGDVGTILHTTNGGTTWISLSRPSGVVDPLDALRRVVTVNPSTAFIEAYETWSGRSYIIETTNGGSTWSRILAYLPHSQYGMSFLNTQYGVALGGDYFYRTTDGGSSWQTLPTPYSYLEDISFSDPRHAMACGLPGIVVSTSDSGNTWSFLNTGYNYNYTHVHQFDSLHAIVTTSQAALVTSDGGASWQTVLGINPGSYNDIACLGLNVIALASPSSVVWSTDGGSSWRNSSGISLQSVAFVDSERLSVVTYTGHILQSLPLIAALPAVSLSLPEDGETNLPPLDNGPNSMSVTVRWHPFDFRDLGGYSYDFEFATDTVSWPNAFAIRYTFGSRNDTAMTSNYSFQTKYFWRMRPFYQNGSGYLNPWSQVRSFTTPPLPIRTVHEIQEDPLSNLLKLDTVQFSEWSYGGSNGRQVSPFRGHWVGLTAKCVVPATGFSSSSHQMIVYDLSATDSGWHGILVKPHTDFPVPSNFANVKAGDIISMVGQVNEEVRPDYAQNSMTVFNCMSLSIVESPPLNFRAISVPLSSIFHGIHPSDTAMYSSAEQYEGMYIELRNLGVTATANDNDGSFTVTDDLGNSILTMDASKWFTLRNHRDPQSIFSIPVIGSRIDTLRGILWTTGNTDVPDNDWGFRLAPIFPGDLVYSPVQNGVIKGIVFNDDNRNGIQDPGEQSLEGWDINLNGKGQSYAISNSSGTFRFSGLDSGSYIISAPDQHVPWQVWSPSNRADTVTIGVNETIGDNNFAVYYPWGWIDGKVFYDVNENGIQESNEPPLVRWRVRLQKPVTDSPWTDSLGHYSFRHSLEGENTVSVNADAPWEIIPPSAQAGQSFTFYDLGQQKSNLVFSVHHIPPRVKLKMTVHDNTQYLRQDLWWGARPGATDGIGGADGHASNFDISEGESELPPRSFAQYIGLFDARFMDPGNVQGYFGNGSWTDIRNFYSPAQTNLYRIAVLPGLTSGGDYPITLVWSKDSVRLHYSGAVRMSDSAGTVVDMKSEDSLVVADRSIQYLYLTASQPFVPMRFSIQWNLLSLPVLPQDASPRKLFPSAKSSAFLYNPGSAYIREDSLRPGIGYWLKFSRGLDSFPHLASPRLLDTIHLSQGWNLIGTLSVPVDVRSVITNPANIVNNFYYFDGHYLTADSLLAEYGYWVKAKQAGDIILSGSAPAQLAKDNLASQHFEKANAIIVTDASGREQRLYFGIDEASGVRTDEDELPPIPPDGIFDVRFATNRMFESVQQNLSREIPIKISSDEYPISIRWEVKTHLLTGSLIVDKKKIPLRNDGSVQISGGNNIISLRIEGLPDVPTAFALEQNYPNPFNPNTSIQYSLPKEVRVSLNVYNILGQKVAVLVDALEGAGFKSVSFDAARLPSGVYFYRLQAGTFSDIKKMILVK